MVPSLFKVNFVLIIILSEGRRKVMNWPPSPFSVFELSLRHIIFYFFLLSDTSQYYNLQCYFTLFGRKQVSTF